MGPANHCQAHLSRRDLLRALPAAVAASGALAQTKKPQIPLQTLNHATITVTDVRRSTEFYQRLFGMPIQARQGELPSLRIGAGPQFLFIGGGRPNAKPGINHLCVTTPGFNPDHIVELLIERGFAKEDAGVMADGPGMVHVRMRPQNLGGAPEGTAELSIGDPDGIIVQIQDPSYAGGAGRLGELVKLEASPPRGLIQVQTISHFTLFVSDVQRSQAFYQDLFSTPLQARQGNTPILGIGKDRQFLALARSAPRDGGPPRISIDHVCLTMDDFHPDRVLKILAGAGIKARGDLSSPAPPLVSWLSIRKEDRGGSKEGTPELYFTDPNGITIQLQDRKYCGGSGVLGEICTG